MYGLPKLVTRKVCSQMGVRRIVMTYVPRKTKYKRLEPSIKAILLPLLEAPSFIFFGPRRAASPRRAPRNSIREKARLACVPTGWCSTYWITSSMALSLKSTRRCHLFAPQISGQRL
jgi:hypothetical protein